MENGNLTFIETEDNVNTQVQVGEQNAFVKKPNKFFKVIKAFGHGAWIIINFIGHFLFILLGIKLVSDLIDGRKK